MICVTKHIALINQYITHMISVPILGLTGRAARANGKARIRLIGVIVSMKPGNPYIVNRTPYTN